MTSFEPNAMAIIMAQVVTMVPLSFTKPCCQRICWSEVRFTVHLLVNLLSVPAERVSRVTKDARDEKSEQASQQPAPIAMRDEIESGQRQRSVRSRRLPKNQTAGCWDETPLRTVHQSPPKKIVPSTTPAEQRQNES